jgi:hypothetical protein
VPRSSGTERTFAPSIRSLPAPKSIVQFHGVVTAWQQSAMASWTIRLVGADGQEAEPVAATAAVGRAVGSHVALEALADLDDVLGVLARDGERVVGVVAAIRSLDRHDHVRLGGRRRREREEQGEEGCPGSHRPTLRVWKVVRGPSRPRSSDRTLAATEGIADAAAEAAAPRRRLRGQPARAPAPRLARAAQRDLDTAAAGTAR